MSCGTALEARRNSDERWTFTPSSKRYTFSGMAPLFTVRRGDVVLLQIDQTQTINGSLFSVVGDSVVLQLKKGDAALLDGPKPDTNAEALFYDVTLTDQTGFENWIVGGPFTLLGLNDVSCGGCNEKVEVTIGGQCIQINIEGGNTGIGASVNLAALNQAVQDAETAATEAETAAQQAEAARDDVVNGLAAKANKDGSNITSGSDWRTALGLGNAATLDVGTAAGTVAAGDDARILAVAGKADRDGSNVNASPFLAAIDGVRSDGGRVNATPFRAALGVNATTFFGNNVPTQGASAAVLYKSDSNPALTTESLGGLHPTGNAYYRYTYNADFNATNAPTSAPSPAATHMSVATNSGSLCDVMAQMNISLALANNTKALGQNIIVGTPSALSNIKLEGLEIDIQPAPGTSVIDGFGIAINAFSEAMPCSAFLVGGVSGGSFANGFNIISGVSGAGLVATNSASMGSLLNSGSGVYAEDAIVLSNGHKLRLSGTGSAHAKLWTDGANNLRYVAGASENHIFRNNADTASQAVVSNDGFDLQLVGQTYRVNGTTVVRSQQAAVANATDAASVITQLNALLDRLRTHGLIAT